MYDYGEKYKALCESQSRRFRAYLDIYTKSVDSDGNNVYTYSKTVDSFGSSEAIINIKIVRGQTTGSFSFGNAYSGEMTVVVTSETSLGKSGDKIVPSVAFIDDSGSETTRAPLGMFFISSITQNEYTKTVKCLDGITLLDKYYTHLSVDYLDVILRYIASLIGTSLKNEELPNNPHLTEAAFKGFDNDNNVILFTRRELCGAIASVNASNAIIDAQGKLYLTVPNFSVKHKIPYKSVIDYTDLHSKNKFTSIYFSDGNETALPNEIDPQSSSYDPNIMIISFPLKTRFTKEEFEANVEDIVKGVSYDGVSIKKQGTGLYEIGDVLTFEDEGRGKSFNNVYVMGITYEISAQSGFIETLFSLAKSETQQQTRGISIVKKVEKDSKQSSNTVKVSESGIGYGEMKVVTDKNGNSGLAISMEQNAQWLGLLDGEGNKILEYIPPTVHNTSTPHRVKGNLWFYPINRMGTDGIYFAYPYPEDSELSGFNPKEEVDESSLLYGVANSTVFAFNQTYAEKLTEAGFTRARDVTQIKEEKWVMNGKDYVAAWELKVGGATNSGGFLGVKKSIDDEVPFFIVCSVAIESYRPIGVGMMFPRIRFPYYDYSGGVVAQLSYPCWRFKEDGSLELLSSAGNAYSQASDLYIDILKPITEAAPDYGDSILIYKNVFLMNGAKFYNEDGTEYSFQS